LEDSFMNNEVYLINPSGYYNDTSFPTDLARQSIVHVKVGVLPRGQQARVTFYFRLTPFTPNTVQIFVNDALGRRFDSKLDIPSGPDGVRASRSTLVVGDDCTSIDVYFRPAGANGLGLFFNRAEVVWV
jgi:hypothetical protein